jgi:hypothetical protein
MFFSLSQVAANFGYIVNGSLPGALTYTATLHGVFLRMGSASERVVSALSGL